MKPKLLLLTAFALVLSGCSTTPHKPPPPDPCEKYEILQYRLCNYADNTEQCRVAGMKLIECVEASQ